MHNTNNRTGTYLCLVTLINVMATFGIICLGGAFLIALVAVRHQRGNFVPRHGSSTGSDIVNLLIWVLVSLLITAASCAFIPWYFTPIVFAICFAFSFLIRLCVDSWTRHLDK